MGCYVSSTKNDDQNNFGSKAPQNQEIIVDKITNNGKITNDDKINIHKIADNTDNKYEKINNNNNNKDEKRDIIGIKFISVDQSVNCLISCRISNYFLEVEKKLYKKYPYLMQKSLLFLVNGYIIDKTITIEENKIPHGCIILIIENEEEDEREKSLDNKEKRILLHFMSSDSIINFELNVTYKPSDKFILVVEKLYNKYPDLRDKNIIFIADGNVIDIFATIQKNKIKNESSILIVEMERIILLRFVSGDQRLNTTLGIPCNPSDKFTVVEERLYEEFPFLKGRDNFFISSGKLIDRNETLKENGIEDDSTICINVL